METNAEKKAHVARLIAEAQKAQLWGASWVAELGVARCAEGYNGIGPEFLPGMIRTKVTDFLKLFEPAALIHDMRNDVSDGERAGFLFANDEFRKNCLILADAKYGMFTFERYRARAVAETLYAFVSADSFGWRAWLEAHERYVKKISARAPANTDGERTPDPAQTISHADPATGTAESLSRGAEPANQDGNI